VERVGWVVLVDGLGNEFRILERVVRVVVRSFENVVVERIVEGLHGYIIDIIKVF
jgi:hypothetical protein